ncbi:putative oxidoreductase YesF [Acrocarpospora pleiomorpha]|uniref:Putative oxidoreductase YesF n=1 Tax=Acrocarpospora pleiomorpha TaxID=90975 RepID=A0A5M3X945_9ACTN|nr:NAD(P)H-binding protein [Acrocarpospora pleiomorpha]GES17186.1 putative oxidoreductase YesF [Acrocarpospora pleiomorpha]
MTLTPRVLVTGATGNTASRLIPKLVGLGVSVTTASRHPSDLAGTTPVKFDWYDSATFDSALQGADRVYLVPPPLDPDPASVMVPFLERARERGVGRAVLLSASIVPSGGPAAGQVHHVLPDLFEQWAALRPSWFMQNFTGSHPHALGIRETGTIVTATGAGRVGFVDVNDVASVAAHALTDEVPPADDLILTGPEALSYDDVAAIFSDVSGREIVHEAVSRQALEQRLSVAIPAEAAAMLAQVDTLISTGAENRTTDTVERITGRAPRALRDVLSEALARH